MSEKAKFEWDAYNPNNDDEYLSSILDRINEINRKTGQPEVRMVSDEEARTGIKPVASEEPTVDPAEELDRAREIELATAREIELDQAREKELEQSRGFDVRRIMAEEAAKTEKAKETEKVKKTDVTTEFERIPTNDPDIYEISIKEQPKREINIIGGEIKSRATKEREEKEARERELANARAEELEVAAIKERLAAIDKELEEAKEAELENPNPLIAVGVDWSESESKLAENLAKKDLKKELSQSSIIKKIWKGKLFKEYYEDKYAEEYLEGKRTDRNGKTLAEAINEKKQGLIDDFTQDAIEELKNHDRKEWGKKGFVSQNGEKLIPVEKETNDKIRETIEDYARFMVEFAQIRPKEASDPEFIKEVDQRFNNYMSNILKKAEKEGKIDSNVRGNNYLAVAKEAAGRYQEIARNATNKVEQDAAMARVMSGFQVYNIESTKSFTVEHKSNISKIVDFIGSKRMPSMVPADKLSNAIDAINMKPTQAKIIKDVKENKALLGGDEGIKIMLDQSPLSAESQLRWGKWWDSLSDEGKDLVFNIVKQVNASPDHYNIRWGNGFRTWLTVINARKILAA